MSKKNRIKARKTEKSSLALVQEILGVIGGIIGSLMAIYGFIKTFRDDASGFTWLLFLGGAIWLVVIWQMFQRQRTYAFIFLTITVVGIVAAWVGWQGQVQAMEDKVIVLIVKFDGPDDEYGLRDQIMEELRRANRNYDDTVIIDGKESVTAGQGSEYARALGKKENADLVIWAWYRPTENPNITIHLENLSPGQISTLEESESYQPRGTLAEMESFALQRKIGSETSSLISFITGVIRYESGDYQTAAERFEQVLTQAAVSTFVDQSTVYSYLGSVNHELGNYDAALQNFNKVLEMNPREAMAYNNRGVTYVSLGKADLAIQDYLTAIEIEPQFAMANMNLGVVYSVSGQSERAVEYFNAALAMDPGNPKIYAGRGFAYHELGKYELAVQDYDRAIGAGTNMIVFYNARARAYSELGEPEKAVKDFDIVLRNQPQNVEVYVLRGMEYFVLENNRLAMKDFNKAIELDPQYPGAYLARGILFHVIGKEDQSLADAAKYRELMGEDAP